MTGINNYETYYHQNLLRNHVNKSKLSEEPEFEQKITLLIENIVNDEMTHFQPGLESYQTHEAKIRRTVGDALVEFLHKLQAGYAAINTAMEAIGYDFPKISIENREGNFQILGLSNEQLMQYYKIAYEFLKNNEFEKGCHSFFFLVSIAPQIAEFWLGYAICCAQLRDYETAIKANLCAINRDPKKFNNYLNCLHLYLHLNDLDKAREICKQGIDYAIENKEESWSQEMVTALSKAQAAINSS